MNLSGEYRIPVSEHDVWDGMNDAELLKRCIAVCERFDRLSETLFQTKLRIKVGPFTAGFTADIHVEDADPPHSYRLRADGTGGLAGWARAHAAVRLAPEGADTILSYDAHADLRGALARVAARAVEGAAQRYADEFFAEFARQVVSRTKSINEKSVTSIAPGENVPYG
jgi:carbon monoxide dehydrogenase subunit G